MSWTCDNCGATWPENRDGIHHKSGMYVEHFCDEECATGFYAKLLADAAGDVVMFP